MIKLEELDEVVIDNEKIYDLRISINDDESKISIKGSQLYNYLEWMNRLPFHNIQQYSFHIKINNKYRIILGYYRKSLKIL